MARSVAELLADFYDEGFATDDKDSDVTVGTGVVQIVGPSAIRTKFRLCNFGGANVVLGRANNVTATTGIQLSPGQTIEFDWADDGDDVTRAWFGISAAAGNPIHVIETFLISDENSG